MLTEKLDVLERMDNEVLGYLSDEDEIEKEVVRCSEIRSEIHQLIVRIDAKIEGTSTSNNNTSCTKNDRNAKLPKLTLNSFKNGCY